MPTPQFVTTESVPINEIQTNFPPFFDKTIKDQILSTLAKSMQVSLNHGSESGPGFLPREQANLQIARVLGYGADQYHLETVRNEHQLIGPLHAAKYHQKQCMYRLFTLEQKSHKAKRQSGQGPSGRGLTLVRTFQFEDLPLRAEFEAFISRVASVLDALAQYTCKCLGKDVKQFGSHFKLSNHLKVQRGVEWLDVLGRKYAEYEEWARTVMRDLRDYVIHEGTLWALDAGKDLSIEQPFAQPAWQGKTIEVLCVETWQTLIQFVEQIRNVLLDYGLTR